MKPPRRNSQKPATSDKSPWYETFAGEATKAVAVAVVGLLIGSLTIAGQWVRAAWPAANSVKVRILPRDTLATSGRNLNLNVSLTPITGVLFGRVPEGTLRLRASDPRLVRLDSLDGRVAATDHAVMLPSQGTFVLRSGRHNEFTAMVIATFTTASNVEFADTLVVRIGRPSSTTIPTPEDLTGTWELSIGEVSGNLHLVQGDDENISGDFTLESTGQSGKVSGRYDSMPDLTFVINDNEKITLRGALDVIYNNVLTFCGPGRRMRRIGGDMVEDTVMLLLSSRLGEPRAPNSPDAQSILRSCK